MGAPCDWLLLEFLILGLVQSLQQFIYYNSGFPILALLPVTVFACHSLYSPVSPISEAAVCPVSSPLLWIQKELLVFLSAQVFRCCEDRAVTSKLLNIRNQKLQATELSKTS